MSVSIHNEGNGWLKWDNGWLKWRWIVDYDVTMDSIDGWWVWVLITKAMNDWSRGELLIMIVIMDSVGRGGKQW